MIDLSPLPILKSDDRGVMYNCDTLKCVVRKKGSISGNHIHSDPEILYLVSGSATVTVGDETTVVEAPMKIQIPGNIHHQLFADSDIIFLEDRHGLLS